MNYSQHLTQPEGPEITIDQVYLDSDGLLEAQGWINGQLTEYSIDPSEKLYQEILPKGVEFDQVVNHEQMVTARMDKWHNIHWLVKLESGQIVERVVNVSGWLEQRLIEVYHKNY